MATVVPPVSSSMCPDTFVPEPPEANQAVRSPPGVERWVIVVVLRFDPWRRRWSGAAHRSRPRPVWRPRRVRPHRQRVPRRAARAAAIWSLSPPAGPLAELRGPRSDAPTLPTTSTNSPRSVKAPPVVAASASSPRPPRRISSWSFVSSRHTATGRSTPHAAARSRSVAGTRDGASYTIVARSSAAIRARRSRRSRPDRGRKPSNDQRGPAIPLATRAASAADGPGIGTTSPPSATQARTSTSPGSDTPGVPASVTSARSEPPRR